MELFKSVLVLMANIIQLIALSIFVGIQAKDLWKSILRKGNY